jgi:hypothetical protein
MDVCLSDLDNELKSCLKGLQDRFAMQWKGREKEALIALVRVLDHVSVAALLGLDNDDAEGTTPKEALSTTFVCMGAAAALRPLLSAVKGTSGGVPWGASSLPIQNYFYSYLHACGELTFLRRKAALSRYGLASLESEGSRQFSIKTRSSIPERTFLAALQNLKAEQVKSEGYRHSHAEWSRIYDRMEKYVDTPDGWFIRYDNDWEIVSIYQDEARRYGRRFREAEALPDDVVIGDRSFGEWKHACDQALGRVLAHVDFAQLLLKKAKNISFSDVLTIFARRDDVRQVWEEAGIPSKQVSATMAALTLESEGLDDWENAFEMPTPFHVDLGKDFVLLPCFGALSNPYFSLFRHLRQLYRTDWDRGVDRREEVFRADLARSFPAPRFFVPPRGFRLCRTNGSVLTDIDAIIIDRQCGSVALVQLKWHDIFGFSLAERESRKRNIGKANEWTAKVLEWVGGRSSQEILKQLQIDLAVSDRPPVIYVIARYMARFSGDEDQDTRAHWMGWPEVQSALLATAVEADPLALIPQHVAHQEKRYGSPEFVDMKFQFPGLEVDLKMYASRYVPE